jgi:hypothetical protein
MDPIHNTYDWLKMLRRKRRWMPPRPEIIGLRGAELVRAAPSELKQPEPVPEPPPPVVESEPVPTPESSAQPESTPEPVSEPEPETEPETSRKRRR